MARINQNIALYRLPLAPGALVRRPIMKSASLDSVRTAKMPQSNAERLMARRRAALEKTEIVRLIRNGSFFCTD